MVALVAAGLLGLWQYHGWQDRRDAEARDLTQVAPIPLADAIGPDDPFPGTLVGQPVEVHGTWCQAAPSGCPAASTRAGTATGWSTPYGSATRCCRSSAAGRQPRRWAQRGPEPRGAVDLVGWLQPSEGTVATDDDPSDDVLPQLRVADLAQRFDEDLYGAYVVVAPSPADGLVRPTSSSSRTPAGSRRSATCSTPSSGGSSARSRLFVWWRWVSEEAESRRGSRRAVRRGAEAR